MKTLNQRIAGFILSDYAGMLKKRKLPLESVNPEFIGNLIRLEGENKLTRKDTRAIVETVLDEVKGRWDC